MGENDTSLEDPPPIMTKESDIELAALGKISLQKGERSVDASLNTLHSNPKRKHIEQGMELVTDSINQYQSDVSDISPCIIKSRYGRTHKPKIPEDFLPTDKKVAAILGHSPHKSPGKVTGSQVSVTAVEVAKVCQKGQGLFDIFVKKDRRSKGNTEMENVNRNSNTVKVGVCNVKSENRDTNSDNAESFSVRDEATSAGNDGLSPGIVKEEVKSDTTDKTCETSELSLCDEKMSGCDWVIGDLAWARVSGYPFWPCMIALDPQQRIFTKTTVRGNFTLRSLHVQFFGDNGRRSWLFSNCVIHFEGLEALNKLEAKVQSAMKKRDRKLAAAFHVAPKAKAKWNLAVKEAEAAVKKTRIERLKSFARQFPQDTSVKVAQTSNASPGRRQQKSVNDDRYNSSKMGSMEEGPHSPSSDVTDANDKDLSLSETPDSKFKISSPQAKKKKRQLKKYSFRGNNFGADFETFLCKHIHRVAQEHPELSTKAVEKYLAKEWSGMDEQQKSRFCSRLTGTNDTEKCTNMSSSEEEDDVDGDVDERQSNESEKADSNDTRDSSPAPFFKLRKGCGLFRGTRQEKVCQICEKPGDTVKCRGPCCGTFHIKCVSEYLAAKDNMNDITPSNVRIKKSKSVLTSHMNKVGINDVSFNVVDGDDKKVSEFTNVSEADGELTKPVSGIANLVEHGNKDEKECSRVSRKRKMFSTEEQICVANKKVDSRKDENEKVSEVKVDSCAVEGNEEEQEYKENVKQETVDELKMDVDKVNDIEELENDSTGTITKRDENQIVDVDEKEIKDDVRECSVIKEENHTEISSDEIPKEVMEDVIKDKTVSDGRRSDRLKGRCYVENKEGKKDAEKGVFAKRGNQDEKGGGKSDCDGSENMMKDAGFCGEKDKYKRTTRLVAKKRDRRDDKEMKADGKEIQKQTKVTSEEKDRDEKKEKGVLKKKGKEEKKGKDGATEEKLVTDCASEFHCSDCKEGRNPPCFACGKIEEEKTGREQRQRCAVGHCGRFYHIECLKLWPHAWSSGSSSSRRQLAAAARGEVTGGQVAVTCPQHVCHTCASDDPRNATTRFAHERLVRCIRCPTAYHTGNYCLPAGSEVLTGTQIICPKHYEPPQKKTYHVNAAWCFICAMGGSLICCDLCPTSFHIECLRLSPPEGGFICEDCDTGRFPLYGEIVWVKLGAYRWWPAQILYPSQIPENIHNLPHVRGEFAVRFFGSHDYYWVNRGRVFLYQEGDTGHSARRKSYMEEMFSCALREANEAHKTLEGEKATRVAEARPVMKPPMYVKIKSNKPVGNVRVTEMDVSSITPCECDPNSANPCGPDADCLNRVLLVECSPSVCRAGERCGNQCFEKRLYPPLIPYRTETRGWGLKTLANIHKGGFVIEYVGEMIDEAEYQSRMTRKHEEKDENYYFLTIDKDRMLDAGPKGNVARFMNHSCQPNCETQKWTVNGDTRVGLFALVDIPAGAELTFNYNLECAGADKKPCMCGAPNCSGFIGVKVNKQVEEDKKPRVESQNSVKRRRKRQSGIRVNYDVCFICGEGGELLFCDNKTCPKGYHIHCLKLKRPPKGKWLCPWHRCNECNKRTTRRCGFCPNSFCPRHADGNIKLHPAVGFVCQEHDKETPANVKEELLDSVAEPVVKMETEEEETNEELSGPAPEVSSTDKEIKNKTEQCENMGIEMIIENEPHVSSEETAVECFVREEPMAKESDLPSSDEVKNGLCDELPDSDIKISIDTNEEKYPEEDILIQNDACSNDDMVPKVSSIVICDEKVMVDQNVTDDLVKCNSDIRKRKRGHPRKPSIQENLERNKRKIKSPCHMSAFNKVALDNELESLAQSFSDNEGFDRKQHKLAGRHKKKLQSTKFRKDTAVNDLKKGVMKKQRGKARKVSSAVANKLGFGKSEIHFEEQCGGSGDFGQETTEEEKEGVDMTVENMPLEVKEDSSIDVQKMCNETKSSSTTLVTVNGIENTNVLILPVES